jgi:two-component system, cell cycle sensor histidine kinase and response regulator CckA
MIAISLFIFSIVLQLTAAAYALLIIKTSGRFTAWILISLAMILMSFRRIVSFMSHIKAGREFTFDLPEVIALIISFLMLIGVILIQKVFKSRLEAEKNLSKAITIAEAEKARSEAIIAAMGDGISIQDTDFKILYQNDVLTKLIGSHTGKYCYTAYEKRDQLCERCPIAMTFSDGKIHTSERNAPTDKGIITVEITSSPLRDSKGKIIAGIEVIRDITERKKAEELLFQTKHDWEDTFNTITDMITVHDKDFNIIQYNKAAEKILDLPSSEIEKTIKCYQYYHGRDCPPEACPSCKCLKTMEPSTFEMFEPHLNMFVEIRAIPRFDSNQQLIGLIHIVRDITEHKKLEEQFRHAQKMEAVGQLTGGIAHDFNNILTAIIGYSNILQMKMKEDDPLKINIEHVLSSAEKAAALTHSLLAFSRKQVINPKAESLNLIINKAQKLLTRLIREDIELRTNLTDKDTTVLVDSGQIEQVLMNLVSNARDAMPGGGLLTIETEAKRLDKEFIMEHGFGKTGNYIVLSISDTGTGMDEKTRDRIFEPFFTTKELGRGTGLGLSMVYAIVKQHNGYINVYSEPGKGTTFRIYLLAAIASVEDNGKRIPDVSVIPEGGHETILVAEDDDTLRKLSRTVLEGKGYKIIEASDGEDAVKKVLQHQNKIDLAILDVIMPKMNGKASYNAIKSINTDIKTIFMSGYTADLINEQGLLDNGATFIFKPVSPVELLRKVREVLDTTPLKK